MYQHTLPPNVCATPNMGPYVSPQNMMHNPVVNSGLTQPPVMEQYPIVQGTSPTQGIFIQPNPYQSLYIYQSTLLSASECGATNDTTATQRHHICYNSSAVCPKDRTYGTVCPKDSTYGMLQHPYKMEQYHSYRMIVRDKDSRCEQKWYNTAKEGRLSQK